MKRNGLLLVFLIAGTVISDRAADQQIEPPVHVGVGKGQKRMEQLDHLYAIDAKIVYTAAKIGTPVLGRVFVSATAHTNCCDPASENAKRGLDIYYLAQDQIANLEQAFETFLLEKKLAPKNAAPRLGNDLNRMCIANRFGLRTAAVKDYNDFIFETISGLQHNPERWKDVEALRKEAQDKCQKAIEALDALEQGQ